MTESKPAPSTATKPGAEIKKPGLDIKPVKDMEPDETQADKVRGGPAGGGKLFSDASLKHDVVSISDALTRLRTFQY